MRCFLSLSEVRLSCELVERTDRADALRSLPADIDLADPIRVYMHKCNVSINAGYIISYHIISYIYPYIHISIYLDEHV